MSYGNTLDVDSTFLQYGFVPALEAMSHFPFTAHMKGNLSTFPELEARLSAKDPNWFNAYISPDMGRLMRICRMLFMGACEMPYAEEWLEVSRVVPRPSSGLS